MTVADQRYSVDAITSLGGPKWLTEYRMGAVRRLDTVTPATSRVEDWRYGRIDELDLADFDPLDDENGPEAVEFGESSQRFLDGVGDLGALIHLVDGRIVAVDVSGGLADRGVSVTAASSSELPIVGLGALLGEVDEPFAALNEAFAPEACVIDIPSGCVAELPIVVISELSGRAIDHLSYARTFISLGSLAEAKVVCFQTSREGRLLHIPAIEMMLGDGAHLRYDSVQDLGPDAWQLAYQLADVGRDATLISFAASLGGDYSRLYTRAALTGEAADSRLFAAYLGVGSQVQEFRTFQDHLAGRTKSDLVFKGAVADAARSVYSGMIHMRKGARRSEASQTNRNLVLSEGAHADSVPNLDIEENDVRCSHASAVGPIDADQLFYLESRGIPPEAAERLILLGFFDDLLARANSEGSAEFVRGIVADRLSLSTLAGAMS